MKTAVLFFAALACAFLALPAGAETVYRLSLSDGGEIATLEAAPSRIELSGGPVAGGVAKVLGTQGTLAPVVRAAERPVRPLKPGEMLVLGPTAGPLSATAIPPRVPGRAAPPVTSSPAVDTLTVRAHASAPDAARSPVAAESWESYRSGNVVRISLPEN